MAAKYELRFKASAWKSLNRLPKEMQGRIKEAIAGLTDNPRHRGVDKLIGHRRFYRIRVGKYRVIFEIFDDILVIHIVNIDHRREAYRGL